MMNNAKREFKVKMGNRFKKVFQENDKWKIGTWAYGCDEMRHVLSYEFDTKEQAENYLKRVG